MLDAGMLDAGMQDYCRHTVSDMDLPLAGLGIFKDERGTPLFWGRVKLPAHPPAGASGVGARAATPLKARPPSPPPRGKAKLPEHPFADGP